MNKLTFTPIKTLFIAMGLLLLSACEPNQEALVSITAEASAVGPFFAGPNSLIAEYQVDLSSIEGLRGVSMDQLKNIAINSIKVSLNESEDFTFDSFASASLQIVSANTDMQTIGIKNPIDSNNQELILQVSEETDVAKYFKNEKFSLVLDLDFLDDSYAEELSAIINLELKVKYN